MVTDRVGPTVNTLKAEVDYLDGEVKKLLRLLADERTECMRLRAALVAEREENLWHCYNTGSVRDGRWYHSFMSDGEWLAAECGFNPLDGFYDDEAIKRAIPVAARAALGET